MASQLKVIEQNREALGIARELKEVVDQWRMPEAGGAFDTSTEDLNSILRYCLDALRPPPIQVTQKGAEWIKEG